MIRHPRIKLSLYIVAAVFAVYTVTGFFLAPWVGEKFLIKRWGHFMGRHAVIESVSINPYTLTILAEGVSIKEGNGVDFISARSLFADFSVASLFRLAPVCTRYEIDSPIVTLVLNKDKTFNFSDMLVSSDKKADDLSRAEQKIFGFKIDNAKIINGQINFSDQILNKEHRLENLNLSLPFLSTLEGDRDTKVLADLGFSLNQGQIKFQLESLPFTSGRDSVVTLKTGSIDLLPYLKYLSLPDTVLVKRVDASLDLAITYSQTGAKAKPSLILTGKAAIANLDLQDALQAKVLTVPQINITLGPSDLLDNRLRVAGLKIVSPKIHLTRDVDGRLNLVKLLPEKKIPAAEGQPPPPEKEKAMASGDDKESSGFVFQLDTGDIVDASLSFTDAANKTPFETLLSPVTLQVQDIAVKNGVVGKYSITLKTEIDEKIASAGQFSTTPLAVEGSVTLERLSLKKYLPYVENFINFDLQEGQLDLDAGFTLTEDENKLASVIHNRQLRLTNLKVWDRVNKELPVFLPEVSITDSVIDTGKQHLDLGKIKTSQGKILLKRQADGSINLVNNLLPEPPGGHQKNADPVSLAVPADENKASAWQISLGDLAVEKYGIDVFDAAAKEPVEIELSDIRLAVGNFKTWGNETADVSAEMAWNQTGRIQIKGDLVLSEQAGDLDVFLEKIDIPSLQPYFTEQVNLLVTRGLVQTQGKLSFSMKEKANPRLSFKGKSAVTDFVSLGKFSGKEFFKCSALHLSGMDISLLPVKVGVEDISLTDFYSRVIISEKGNINLSQIMAGDEKEKGVSPTKPVPAAQKENTSPRPEITISNVTLQGGAIYFEDNFTQPNVSADMKEIAGQLRGLSSIEGQHQPIFSFAGCMDGPPLEIVGRISPLALKQFLDLNISFKDIELTRFSPYSGKYIGYEIQKGKLVLDLNYQIDGNVLKAKNRFFLDQFTLGKKVNSKDATTLPVPLAISLLKNADGHIDLNVPLSGNLNDPKFSVSVAFFEVLKNLIMKVITSPFKVLGAMFGGREDLGFVNFEYGSDVIPEKEIQKINALIEILDKKKELKLEIKGTYDRIAEGDALRKKAYDLLIKSEKLKRLAAKGTPVLNPEALTLLPEEWQAAVLAAYELADFPKPMEKDGKEKQISLAEKEKLLLTHVQINEKGLKELAINRAENVKHHILSTEKVRPERIFLLNADEAVAVPDQEPFGRVIFSIK